jgi:site-specific DNA-methyltransferase (cytosine-N4-specific)
VALPDFFIRLLTRPGDLVVDPFAGTCTTAVAAEQRKRRWFVTELDASYTTILPERLARGR